MAGGWRVFVWKSDGAVKMLCEMNIGGKVWESEAFCWSGREAEMRYLWAGGGRVGWTTV